MAAVRARDIGPVASLDDLARAAEGSLAVLLQEARRTGAVYTALHLGWEPDGRQTEARLLVVLRRFGPDADPIELVRALRARSIPPPRIDEREVGLVQYGETVVVRRAGLMESEQGRPLLHHEYYFPVPHHEERLALLDFTSPSIASATRMGEMFASMAASFRFTEA
jgi:hypothetical protein